MPRLALVLAALSFAAAAPAAARPNVVLIYADDMCEKSGDLDALERLPY